MGTKLDVLQTVAVSGKCCDCTQPSGTDTACNRAGGADSAYWQNRMRKPIAVLYATREGTSKQVAERVAGTLRARGFYADLKNLRELDAPLQFAAYSMVMLAGSVHAGKHESEMTKFASEHHKELEQMPSALFSVTLSEAGAEMPRATAEERARFTADVRQMVEAFSKETGWRPKWVKPVAGGLLYTKYNPLTKFVMKRIAKKVGAGTDTSRDYIYTDWDALDRFVNDVAKELSASGAANDATAVTH